MEVKMLEIQHRKTNSNTKIAKVTRAGQEYTVNSKQGGQRYKQWLSKNSVSVNTQRRKCEQS